MSDYSVVYVFIREDLTHPQQVVQAVHSSLRMAKFAEIPEEPPYVVVCSVKNELKLMEVEKHLITLGIEYGAFRESDLNDEMTSITTIPLSPDKKPLFKKYQLLRSGKCKQLV